MFFCNQDSGGKPPLTGIQLVVPKPPKNYSFMSWNWPIIRKTFFWSLMSMFAGCVALAIGIIATMPKSCDPPVEWWQGSLFYEIFPASFEDAYKNDGIGDFRGIVNRLVYVEKLGVKGIRLNSVFPAKRYPQHYMDIESLTDVDPNLGTLTDFTNMVTAIHKKNMTLILDLPLYPFVKNFGEEIEKLNSTNHRKRNELPSLPEFPPHQEAMDVLMSASSKVDVKVNLYGSINNQIVLNPLNDNVVTKAIRFWHEKEVDGFYLKGLEYYTNETNFIAALRYWKSILGPNKILMCSDKALKSATDYAANAILNIMDLVDVALIMDSNTRDIRIQVSKILKGLLFKKAGYPWVHWSTGSVETPRLASKLKTTNASVAVAMMSMMLPGTSNIFYGDEIGMLNSESKDNQDLENLYQLVPMHWDSQSNDDQTVPKPTKVSWMRESTQPTATNLTGLVSKMSRLRSETMPIYVKALLKNKEPIANGDVRYAMNEILVIERWYPRRNTYVFVANLGTHTQTKDLSSLYYGGHVVIGPDHKLNRNIYFRALTIPPGEALIIKLDK